MGMVRSKISAGRLAIGTIAPFARNSIVAFQHLSKSSIANNGGRPFGRN